MSSESCALWAMGQFEGGPGRCPFEKRLVHMASMMAAAYMGQSLPKQMGRWSDLKAKLSVFEQSLL